MQAFSNRFGLTAVQPAIPIDRLRHHAGGGSMVCVLMAALQHMTLCPSGSGDGLETRVCPGEFEGARCPFPAYMHIAIRRHT
jgi:hypothetical protein